MGGDDQRKGRTQRATPRTAWLCISCTNPKGERWHNKADALQCTGRCKRPKGLCFGQKAGKGGCPTVSVRAQQAAKHEEELKRLRAENEALMEKVAAVDAATAGGGDEGEAAAPKSEQKEIEAQLGAEREALRKLKSTPADVVQFLRAPLEQLVAEAEAKVRDLDAKRRGLKPLGDQLKQSRVYLANMEEKLAKDINAAEETEAAILKLKAELEEKYIKVQRTKEIVDGAKAEVASLSAATTMAEGATDTAHAAGSVTTPVFTEQHVNALQAVLRSVNTQALGSSAGPAEALMSEIMAGLRLATRAAKVQDTIGAQPIQTQPNPIHRSPGTQEAAARMAVEAEAEMELDGLSEDQVNALAALEVRNLEEPDPSDEEAKRRHADKVEDVRAKVRANYKVRKKVKGAH